MIRLSTIANHHAAFGARWDDTKEKARFEVKFTDITGYYDSDSDIKIDTKTYPAPSLISKMINIRNDVSAISIHSHDDKKEIFFSFIMAAGQIVASSEVIYENEDEWKNSIKDAVADGNIESVYAPQETLPINDEKYKTYSFQENLDSDELPILKTVSSIIPNLMIAISALAAFLVLGGGIWFLFLRGENEVETFVEKIIYITEKRKPDYDTLLKQCIHDLKEPWPSSPEWVLRQEGCVLDPNNVSFDLANPEEKEPFVYRHYTLGGGKWDDLLSHKSFRAVSNRFPGNIIEGSGEFLLYVHYELEDDLIDDDYVADQNPAAILRQNFHGILSLDGSGEGGVLSASTDLEMDQVVKRLLGKPLTTGHLYRDIEGNQTKMDILPERINENRRQVE